MDGEPSTSSAPGGTGSIQVHRVRFVDYNPSPITALAFTPLPLPPADSQTAAQAAQWIRDQQQREYQLLAQQTRNSATQTGKAKANGLKIKGEFGALICARQNGQIDVWEWVESKQESLVGGWALSRVLPAILSHPNVSAMGLVIRDPSKYLAVSQDESPTNASLRRVPTLEEIRLFTAGSDSGDLVERCLFTGRILQTIDVPASPIWALAVSPTHDHIAVASSSSNIHLYRLSSDPFLTELEPASPIHRFEGLPGKTRTLGIAWGPPIRTEVPVEVDEEDAMDQEGNQSKTAWQWRNTYLVTGNSDSSVRKWNVATGRLIGRIVVNKLSKQKKSARVRQNIVWAVGVLSDHTIVSADSLGHVTFFDGRSLTPSQSLPAHAADAMCLAIGPNGKSIYTSGPDQKIAEFTRVQSEASDAVSAGRTRWILTRSKRVHQHDVRALAVFPPFVSQPATSNFPSLNPTFTPLVASGGLDMQVILTPGAMPEQLLDRTNYRVPISRRPITTFAEADSFKTSSTPGGSAGQIIASSASKRLIVVHRYRSLGIWRVLQAAESGAPFEHLLELSLQLRSSLVSAALSADGKWLAASDLYETKLFRLEEHMDEEDRPTLKARRVKELPEVIADATDARSTGSRHMVFTPDSRCLVMGSALAPKIVFAQLPSETNPKPEVVAVLDIRHRTESERMTAPLPRANGHTNGRASKQNGTSMEIDTDDDSSVGANLPGEEEASLPSSTSQNGRPSIPQILAVSEDGQWLACVDNYNRTSVYSIDLLKLHCVLPTFKQSIAAVAFASDRKLVLAFPINNTFQAYDIDERVLDNRYIVNARTTLSRQADSISGLFYSAKHRKLFAWGPSWVGSVIPGAATGKRLQKKRKQAAAANLDESGDEDMSSKQGVAVTQKFRSIAGVVPIEDDLVVVERPFTDISGLPPAFDAKKYGT